MLMVGSPKDGFNPLFVAWFGNFFEPYFSSKEAVADGLKDLKSLGFNGIVLDSKLWSNFSSYFKEGKLTPYIEMQLYIAECCKELGLGVSFLPLYHCGDNLYYLGIYDYPPEFVEPPLGTDGRPLHGYRHWSEKQLEAQVEHCLNLYKHIAHNAAHKAVDEQGRERLPFYFYQEPLCLPSFDKDGQEHYRKWLKSRYDIGEINRRYDTAFKSIDAIDFKSYWYKPESAGIFLEAPSKEEYESRSPNVYKYADNQLYRLGVMREYFKNLCNGLRKRNSRFYLYPGLAQWKYFYPDRRHFKPWDVSLRGFDLWDIGEYADSATFTTVPLDAQSVPNAYVVSSETAMMRSASQGGGFVASLYMGRYLYIDIYDFVTPEEVIASAFAQGATDLHIYGYNGLDDGGNYGSWTQDRKESLKRGLSWFAEARKIAGKRLRSKAALLYPFATAVMEHVELGEVFFQNRHDLLGWHKQLGDCGINPDVIHPRQASQQGLEGYQLLCLPADPAYDILPNQELEKAVLSFVNNGGIVIHSAASGFAGKIFAKGACAHQGNIIIWGEKILVDSPYFVSYTDGEPLAWYFGDKTPAIVRQKFGRGYVYSIGFNYGYAYADKQHLPATGNHGRDNHYPLTMLKQTPVEALLHEHGFTQIRHRGIEITEFQNGKVIVNHTSYPFRHGLRNLLTTSIQAGADWLGGHTAVFVQNKD